MPRLLIQCQGSPGPLSFKMTRADQVDVVLHHYLNHHRPQLRVIPLTSDNKDVYYVNLATVSWICVIAESEPEPKPTKMS